MGNPSGEDVAHRSDLCCDWRPRRIGVFEQVRIRGTEDDRPILTVREREVLTLMAEGLTGPQIAERLIVALPTVKTYQARLYEKLGVSERAAAVAEAMRRGLLE